MRFLSFASPAMSAFSCIRAATTHALVVFSVLVACSCSGFAQFASLVARVPKDANALIMLNAEGIRRSPLARKQGWDTKLSDAYEAGLIVLPPQGQYMVMASKIDLDFMEPVWEVALLNTSQEVSIPKVAARWGGSIDNVGSRSAARLPDDSYVVQLADNRVGSMRPANRQDVSRWVRGSDRTSVGGNMSPFLTAVSTAMQRQSAYQIILAIELSDAISQPAAESFVARKLEMPDSAKRLGEVLSSIRGATFSVAVGNAVRGQLSIDFAQDASALDGKAKDVLLAVLAERGAQINEFEDWDAEVKGSSVYFTGVLGESGLRRTLSFLDVPAMLHDAMPSPGEVDEETTVKLASQQYFQSIVGLIEDLQKTPDNSRTTTFGSVGMWFHKYADKIDGLPILNVDEELLDYGAFVSGSFRDAEAVLRGMGGQSRVRQMNSSAGSSYDYGYGYGRWGSYGYYGNNYYNEVDRQEATRQEAANRARINTEVRVEGATNVRDIMQGVSRATSEVRRAMTQKYQAEF